MSELAPGEPHFGQPSFQSARATATRKESFFSPSAFRSIGMAALPAAHFFERSRRLLAGVFILLKKSSDGRCGGRGVWTKLP
jgi:hypothetical protein